MYYKIKDLHISGRPVGGGRGGLGTVSIPMRILATSIKPTPSNSTACLVTCSRCLPSISCVFGDVSD